MAVGRMSAFVSVGHHRRPLERPVFEEPARYPVCRSRAEFLLLARAAVGPQRLREALKSLSSPTAWDEAIVALRQSGAAS